MEKKAASILSAYSFISTRSIDEILVAGYKIKNGIPIPSFEENLLIDLCLEAREILEKEENVLEINSDIIIVGDIHGSFHDLLRILKFTVEKYSKILFLGDYVDRGEFSLECITLLFALKVMYPDMVYLLRGNHEFDSTCSQYGFKNEILSYNNLKKYYEQNISESSNNNSSTSTETQNNDVYTYTKSLYDAFISTFSYLPIGAIVNHTTFCIHGGLSPELNLIDEINKKIKRPINSYDDCQLLADLVWSDPSIFTDYPFEENPRGYGYLFNHDAVNYFLKSNSIKRVIRAHQVAQKGIMKHFDEKCITVFSISSYKEALQNSSAILQIYQTDDNIKATIFHPLNHLSKREAFYYKFVPQHHHDHKNKIFFTLCHPILIAATTVQRLPTNKKVRPIKLRRNIPMISASTPKFVTNIKKPCAQKKKSVHNIASSE